MNRRSYLLSLIAALFTTANVSRAQSAPLKVVTTLNYLRYLTEQIGGVYVDAYALANPEQDPHYVTPTPRMNQRALDADLFIENGLGLDLWATNVLDASGNPVIQRGSRGHLLATLNVPVKELPTEVSRSWGDIHPQGNPHVWLDPLNIKIIAENIAARLSQLDPTHASVFQKNLQAFKDRIDERMFGEQLLKAVGPRAGDILSRRARYGELFTWLQARNLLPLLGGWMKQAQALTAKKIVSYHKTYVYFAERFSLQIVTELEEKPGIPPPPQRRDAIVELMKREDVRVILNDSFYSRDAADYVAAKTGAKVVLTYIDVGANESVNTYEKLISFLLDSLVQAFSAS
jgi:zinc/manganese transport system substrate-binding protein